MARGLALGDRVVAQAEALHRPRLEVLGHDVEARDEREEEVATLGGLEVDAETAFAEVVAQVGGADGAAVRIGHRGSGASPRFPVDRVLDLDHLGTEARQQLGRVGECLHLLRREDPDAIERLAELLRVGVRDVTESHVGHCREKERSRRSGFDDGAAP